MKTLNNVSLTCVFIILSCDSEILSLRLTYEILSKNYYFAIINYHKSVEKIFHMEANKVLILTIIQADLKHHQLVSGLESLHLHTDSYFLGLHKAVSQLMGLGEETSDQWFEIYDQYLKDAHTHPISEKADSLLPVAEECYNLLCASIKIENRLKD